MAPRSSLRARALGAIAACLALYAWPCAAQLNPATQREITSLLQAVGKSGCQFIRGGTAYRSDQAQEHLTKKFEYMAARDMLVSAEDFIDKVASRSNMSGEDYAIRCGEAAAQKSGDWLRAKLKLMRQPLQPAQATAHPPAHPPAHPASHLPPR